MRRSAPAGSATDGTGDVVDDRVGHAPAVDGGGLQVVEAQGVVQLMDALVGSNPLQEPQNAHGYIRKVLVEVVNVHVEGVRFYPGLVDDSHSSSGRPHPRFPPSAA